LKTMDAATHSHKRYNLILVDYPSPKAIEIVGALIYGKTDRNLLATLSSTPYAVGRSFSSEEFQLFHDELKKLQVHHRFICKDSDEQIEFKPKSLSEDASAPIPTTAYQAAQLRGGTFWKNPYWIGGVTISLALAMGLYLVPFSKLLKSRPSNISSAPIGEAFDASVVATRNRVEYRGSADIAWRSANLRQGLFDRDSLRTFDDAWATLQYRAGDQIRVRENSLVMIGSSHPEDETVELKDGSLRTRLAPSSIDRKFTIETASGKISIRHPQSDSTESTQVETNLKGDKLSIAVSSGEVEFFHSDPDQKSIVIGNNQQVTATKTSLSKLNAYTPILRLMNPEDNQKITIDESIPQKFRFEWEQLGENAIYEWVLSTDARFENILNRQNSKHTSLELTYLDHGKLYWQVRGEWDGVNYQSPIYTIYVQKSDN